MRIGISSWACPWAIGVKGFSLAERPMDLMDLLDRAIGYGAEVLQVADNLPLNEQDPGIIREWAARAGEAGIALEIGTRGLNPENLGRYLDLAIGVGACLVRTLPHDGSDRPDAGEALRRLKTVKKDFESAGVSLAIENHDLYPSCWLRKLVEEAESSFIGVCLDAVNNLGLGESFRETLSELGSLTINFHCKDYSIARKPSMLGFDVTGCPAGEGMLNLGLARSVLKDEGMSWIVESWLDWQNDIVSTVRIEKDWLERSVKNLKAFREKK